jgi:hypothetical protein
MVDTELMSFTELMGLTEVMIHFDSRLSGLNDASAN